MSDNATFVLLHGAGLGSYIWRDVVPLLDRPCVTIDFPGRGHGPEETTGLTGSDYADHINQKLDSAKNTRLIIVCHSVAGLIGQSVANRLPTRIVGFVGVGAAFAQPGRSFASTLAIPQRFILPLILRIAGTQPPEKMIRNSLCAGLTQTQSDEVVARFTPESKRLFLDPATVEPPDVESLYLHLCADTEIPPSAQHKAAGLLKNGAVRELPCGHLPMLQRPDLVAWHLNGFTPQ